MTAANKKNEYIEIAKKPTAMFFLLLAAFFCAGFARAAAPYANITACTQPPDPVTTNPSGPGSPSSPVINYQIGNDPSNPVNRPPAGTGFAARYQMQISADSSFSSLTYDTGQQAYGTSYTYENGAVAAGCDFRILNQCYCYVGGVIAPCSGVPPTTVSGHPAPRCGCDSAPDSGNCPNSFNASAGDPGNCYDWYEEPVGGTVCSAGGGGGTTAVGMPGCGYSCNWDWNTGIFSCSCPAGGTCATFTCSNPWDPFNPGCVCTDGGACSNFLYYYDENYGYLYYCADNPCVFQKATQFTKTEHLALQPAGNYSFTVPAGTLSINNSTYYYQVRVKDEYDWSPWAGGSFTFIPPNPDGECGTSSSGAFCSGSLPSLPTPELCLRHDPARPPGPTLTGGATGPWSWTCYGTPPSMVSPTCSASVLLPPDCGTAPTVCEGGSLSCQPGMCTEGGTCTMTGATSWKCENSCGAKSCGPITPQPKIDGQCGTLNGKNFCQSGAPTSNLCSPSSSYNNDLSGSITGFEWTWSCGGACGGNLAHCRAGTSKACGWQETNP